MTSAHEKIEAYRHAVAVAAIASNMLEGIDFAQLISDIDKADAIEPLVDPTLYRERSKAMHEDRALFVAAMQLASVMKRGGEHA